MKLYDALITRIRKELSGQEAKCFSYDESRAWPEHENHEMILQKDMAYELGSMGHPSVNLTCVTSNPELFGKLVNEIYVYGSDLQEITSDRAYARLSMVYSDKIPEETNAAYQALQDIDFVKYHVLPEGYMIRTSGQSGREQVRVGKKALSQGMTFEQIGNTFLKKYLELPEVTYAKVYFLVADGLNYEELEKIGRQAFEIKNSLSMIKEGLPTECSICDIRNICNEVEGLRELHFGNKARQKRGLDVK